MLPGGVGLGRVARTEQGLEGGARHGQQVARSLPGGDDVGGALSQDHRTAHIVESGGDISQNPVGLEYSM